MYYSPMTNRTREFEFRAKSGEKTVVEIPQKWVICDRCDGNGKHDHPAFSNGISQEQFDEDPDFRDDYFAGHYDVRCEECHGSGKVLADDLSGLSDEVIAALEDAEEEEAYNDRVRAAEMRYFGW